MAGESPDKSEQRKSSGGTASGERDPRLAVFQESAEPANPADSADSAGRPEGSDRVDQPTAVFKMPMPPERPEAGDARLRAAVAAWVATADTPDAEDDSVAGADADTPDAAENAADEPPANSRPAAPQADASRTAPAAEAQADTHVSVRSESPEDAPTTDTNANAEGATPDEDTEPSSDASDEDERPADSVAGRPPADAQPRDTPGAGRDDSPVDASDANETENARGAAPADSAAAAPEAGAGAGGGDKASAGGPAEGKAGVDQPTAVFKAVRPRPAVDQPTTALKAVSKPESAAERTSKFVALKRDEVRPAGGRPRNGPAGPPPAASAPAPTPASAPMPEAERTRQQPMPPLPPLDLLAELTNTPPRPETPVRTAVRRVKIWTPLVLLLVIVFGVVQAVRPLPQPQLTMTAEQTFTFDGERPSLPWPENGQAFMAASGAGTLGSSGEQTPVPIASVTKSMTAYVILKNHPLKRGEDGPLIEIDATGEAEGHLDESDNESTLNTVKEGDKLTLRDALAAIMIPSANNIARQLARWDAGSEEAFVEKMNDAAKDLGMTNTTYTDPSGLDATTVSTAEDQVKLGLELVEMPALMDVTKLPTWTDPSGKSWRNWNDLVPYNGALGIKTGSTTKAGGNLLFAAHKQVGGTDQLIVGAVLAQHATPILGTAIAASKELMLATQDTLTSRTLVKKGDVVGTVDDGLGGTTPVVATKDVKAVGWPGLTVKLVLSDGGSTVPHSAKAGTEVGTLTVGKGASQVKVPVALEKDLAEPGLGAKLQRIG